METLADIGEHAWLRRLRPGLAAGSGVIMGAGDDAAVVRHGGEDLLLTSDAVMAGRHFAPGTDPRRIGHKALARSLSDIAAMGGEAVWALIDFVGPADTPVSLVSEIFAGIDALARRFGVAIVGGDTAGGRTLELHVFVVGRVPEGMALFRAGARGGDLLLVTGPLGNSRHGHHLDFLPRLAEGRALRPFASSMIDVSDGLAADAAHLAEASGVGFRLREEAIPRRPAAAGESGSEGAASLEQALRDGEDYELLFTLAPENLPPMREVWRRQLVTEPPVVIGEAVAGAPALWLSSGGADRVLPVHGFDHFKPSGGVGA